MKVTEHMASLTIFSAPKPFTDPHIATIQRNAIRSWINLGEDVDVILIGEEAGLAETAAEIGVRHLPDVKRNEFGTPLVSSIFRLAIQSSKSPVLAYLNADILVMPDFVTIARQVAEQVDHFLVVGQRWDLDVRNEMDFGPGWPERLRDEVLRAGSRHPPAGSDYFIFPRDGFAEMPDFAIGRAGWDNWTIYHACTSSWAVIDATHSLMVVHQNHDYSHLPGGRPHYDLEESHQNAAIGGGLPKMYTVLETNKTLVNGQILPARMSALRLLRQIELRLMDGQTVGARWSLARKVRRLRRRLTGSL
jgi:hypothetical protein